MMSSDETSSPVSASTFRYLIRWPVFLLIWLKLIFSESEVAGYKATGQVTSERRKKPFQLARGAIRKLQRNGTQQILDSIKPAISRSGRRAAILMYAVCGLRQTAPLAWRLAFCSRCVLIDRHERSPRIMANAEPQTDVKARPGARP